MRGMSAQTGRELSGQDHMIQSIRTILTTPIGTRIMRREFGSNLFELIDAPVNAGNIIELYAATAIALDRWEPRFKLDRVVVNQAEAGKVILDLQGEYLPDGQPIKIEGLVL